MKKLITPSIILVLAVFLTNFIPFTGYFENIDTLVHEFGHALVTLLLSGHVDEIKLFADHSGLTYSTIKPGWREIPISLAGYMSASIFVVFLFKLYKAGSEKFGLSVLSLIAIVSLIFFIRNPFGIGWTVGFIILNVLATISNAKLRKMYYLVVSLLLVIHSFESSLIIMAFSVVDPSRAGDATNLDIATGIPAFVYSFIFVIFSAWCSVSAIRSLLKSKGQNAIT